MASTHRPSRDDLVRAHEAFRAHESRDLFYRAATALVRLAKEGVVDLTTGEAIAVLLRTWNSAYYRYHPTGTADYAIIEELIAKHGDWLDSAARRTITSLTDADEAPLLSIFDDFEAALGPVGAAKALHLLAPGFMPLWDRAIAAAYVGQLGRTGTNGLRYLRFMRACREQSITAGAEAAAKDGNILKALDEYNYCVFTKGWIKELQHRCTTFYDRHRYGISSFRTVYQMHAWIDTDSPSTTVGTARLDNCRIPCCASTAGDSLLKLTVQEWNLSASVHHLSCMPP